MKFISVIPARKGSKSIKNKNVIKIKNKPLIEYTFDQINRSKLSRKNSYVISNDKRVKKIAKKNNINIDYIRPNILSTSKTSLLETLKHFVKWTENCKIEYNYLVVLQPTSPLRSHKDINKSIANTLQRVFERPWQHTQHNREFAFVNMQKKRAGITVKRWLVMRDVVDEFEQQIEDQPVINIAERLERNKNG